VHEPKKAILADIYWADHKVPVYPVNSCLMFYANIQSY